MWGKYAHRLLLSSGSISKGLTRIKIDDFEQFGHIYIFGRKTAPEHIVGIGHQLHADPFQIGMEFACGDIDRLAGLQASPD